MPESVLDIRDLNVFLGESHILQDVTLRGEEGAVLGLFGPNGAGKTTLLRTVMGQIAATSGRLRALGKDLAGLAPHQISGLGIAVVPQGRRIFASLTVRENMEVARRRIGPNELGNPWTLDRAFSIFPRLADKAGRLGAHLSGGEQQMLAVGRALMNNPSLLLLDEPCEGLAPQIVETMVTTLRGLKSQGISVVLVEQNLRALAELSDQAYLLKAGRSVAIEQATLKATDRSKLYELLDRSSLRMR